MSSWLTFKERIQNQIDMILDLADNESDETESVRDLFEIFESITHDVMKKNKVQDREREDTIDSIRKSKECFINGKKLEQFCEQLKSGDRNSFLVVPIISLGHMFSSVLRKNEDESYSFTLVNKGDRGEHSQFEEFTVDKYNAEDLINVIRKYQYDENRGFLKGIIYDLETLEVYDKFYNALGIPKAYKIESCEQKQGNCFLKEIEFAIKTALATRNTSLSSMESMQKHPKWMEDTSKIHEMYVEKLLKKYEHKLNPRFIEEQEKKLDNYKANKEFRELLKKGTINLLSLETSNYLVINCLDKVFDKEYNIRAKLNKLNEESLELLVGNKICSINTEKETINIEKILESKRATGFGWLQSAQKEKFKDFEPKKSGLYSDSKKGYKANITLGM